MLSTIVYVLLGALSLWALHQLALWLERRGWLFYRHRRPSSSALAGVFMELDAITRPAARHEIEFRQKELVRDDESGDPLEPGRRSRADYRDT